MSKCSQIGFYLSDTGTTIRRAETSYISEQRTNTLAATTAIITTTATVTCVTTTATTINALTVMTSQDIPTTLLKWSSPTRFRM